MRRAVMGCSSEGDGNVAGTPASPGQSAERADSIQGWPKEGFGDRQTGGVKKTASGTIVFDGPSWGSLVMEDPDAYNP